MLLFRGAVVRGPASVVRLFCRSPLLSCLVLRVLRATLRGLFNPLLQVHPDKWYPSVGTQPTERVGCATRGQTNGTMRAPPLVGYLDEDTEADITACSPNRLVYSLLPEDKLLTDEDRLALSLIDKCAKLAVFIASITKSHLLTLISTLLI